MLVVEMVPCTTDLCLHFMVKYEHLSLSLSSFVLFVCSISFSMLAV